MWPGVGVLALLPWLWLGPASLEPTPCEDPQPGPVIESPHDADVLAKWLQAVRHRVHAKWTPPRATAEGESETLVLRFVVGRRGQVSRLEAACSSGSRALEKASRRAIKAATPLPPLPVESRRESLTLRWRFHYQWRDGVDEGREDPAESWVR